MKRLDVKDFVALLFRLKIAFRLHSKGIKEEDVLGESFENIGAKIITALNM